MVAIIFFVCKRGISRDCFMWSVEVSVSSSSVVSNLKSGLNITTVQFFTSVSFFASCDLPFPY